VTVKDFLRRPALRWAPLVPLAAALCWHARAFDFVDDDAYISFVYARNFAEHNQLVYNLGDRAKFPPYGLFGGEDGLPHRYRLISRGRTRFLKTKEVGVPVLPGDVFFIESSGGGGWGDPRKRDPRAHAEDLENGFVTNKGNRRSGQKAAGSGQQAAGKGARSIGQVVEWSIGAGEARSAKSIARRAKNSWQLAAGRRQKARSRRK